MKNIIHWTRTPKHSEDTTKNQNTRKKQNNFFKLKNQKKNSKHKKQSMSNEKQQKKHRFLLHRSTLSDCTLQIGWSSFVDVSQNAMNSRLWRSLRGNTNGHITCKRCVYVCVCDRLALLNTLQCTTPSQFRSRETSSPGHRMPVDGRRTPCRATSS